MRLTIVRHGEASPAENDTYEGDLARRLSIVGEMRALARLLALGKKKYDLVLSSQAQRCTQLAAILTGIPEKSVTTLAALIPPAPGDGGIGDAIDAEFKELGYAPLRAYLAKSEAMREFGIKAAEAIKGLLKELPADAEVLIANHAVCSQAIVLAMMGTSSLYAERVLDMVLEPTEGIVLDVNGRGVADLIKVVRNDRRAHDPITH